MVVLYFSLPERSSLISPVIRSPSALRAVRSVQVLEWIGTEDAKALLGTLATGSPYALQTREAKAALERLEARQKSE